MSQELESSLKSPLGQIEEITRCKQHNELILSGRHRFKILNTLGKTPRAKLYDCEAKAKELNISHEMVHWLVISESNVRRPIPEEEQKADVLQMAAILERDGVPAENRADMIAALKGLTSRRIRQLLPPEHKRDYERETVSELGGKGEASVTVSEMAHQQGPVGGSSPPSPLHGEDASKHRISAYTEAEQLFAGNLSYYGIEYRTQEKFERKEEFKKILGIDFPKIYVADFYLPKQNVIIELEGEGSASSNNEPRDAYFAKQGIKIAHLPNAVAKKYGAQIAELIAVLLK